MLKKSREKRRKEKYLIIFFTAMGFDKIILLHPNKRNESDLPILPNHRNERNSRFLISLKVLILIQNYIGKSILI